MLERLVSARLVTADDTTVELAHDALIREWPQLRRWIDGDRERRRTLTRLTRAAYEWEEQREDPSDLWRGPASHRVGGRDGRAAHHERAPVPRRQRGRPTHRGTAGTPAAFAGCRALLAGVGVALVLALVAGLVATRQRDRADTEAARARAAGEAATVGQLVAESKVQQDDDRYLGALLAVEANDRQDDPDTEGALMSALLAEPRRVATLPTGPSSFVATIPNTSLVAVLGSGHVSLWDVDDESAPIFLSVDARVGRGGES